MLLKAWPSDKTLMKDRTLLKVMRSALLQVARLPLVSSFSPYSRAQVIPSS